ncbi:hypothetical protein AB0D56_38655 [Streptomyces sp. NPDC048209]|uniref:hypothetical protein n=1 Tax=Streptomycetaceae TaxID=2062 RepID=UPI0034399347
MSGATYINALSAAVSVGGAALTWRNARGAKLHTGFELARTLYETLVSPQMSGARDALEFYRRAQDRDLARTEAVLASYFAVLWCFEGILIGRRSLVGQRRLNGTGAAVAYLDEAIGWHLRLWAERWPEVRGQVKEHIIDLEDQHSLGSFVELAGVVLGETPEVRALRVQLTS